MGLARHRADDHSSYTVEESLNALESLLIREENARDEREFLAQLARAQLEAEAEARREEEARRAAAADARIGVELERLAAARCASFDPAAVEHRDVVVVVAYEYESNA